MEIRSLFSKIFGNKPPEVIARRFELLSDSNSNFYTWNGKIFENDIVRSAIRPKASAVGKLNPKHVIGEGAAMKINPRPQLKMLFQKPNPYMSMQDLLMKLTFQREIHHNAFAYLKRDTLGNPVEVYPIPFNSVEALEKNGDLFIRFWFMVGKYMVVPYVDLIHLRKDFYSNDLFGDGGRLALANIMEVLNTTDQGIVNAVKNSAVVKWIMTFKQILQPKDVQVQVDSFVKNYLAIDKTSGVAVADPRYDLKEVTPQNYVPNAAQMKETIARLWAYFGVNEFIVQNKYNEDQWNAFFESEIEPIAMQLSNAFTRAFFSDRELGFGNRIIFEASSLEYASMTTKLGLVAMVDRGAMTPNEWRTVLNLGPIEGGDKPIRRLDTAPVDNAVSNPAPTSTAPVTTTEGGTNNESGAA